MSAELLIEHLIDNACKVEAVKQTALVVLRFPGGSQSSYYDWRRGLLSFPRQSTSSGCMKLWAAIAPRIARALPHGVTLEDYTPFARAVGASGILVPNLETSTVGDQQARFEHLVRQRVLPTLIELGNEFDLARLGDPALMRRVPDEPTTMAARRRYEQALRPLVGEGYPERPARPA